MSNWFTRLFRPRLLGHYMHSWCYGSHGRSYVRGKVILEEDDRLLLGYDGPGGYSAYWVWRHDARPMWQDLPVDEMDVEEEKGT